MHLVNFPEIDAVIKAIKGDREVMNKYIETINECITKLPIDDKLKRSLDSQFNGVSLAKKGNTGKNRIVLLTPTPINNWNNW